ncbi:hypothetical protein GOP47_0011119 [Adiantum capillus-veneris]|uniref:Uncharacterized protein n=1 Tax=Adiantum capillus-veneris TaxID=13818 RepID=A0A9D4ZHJ4_ADICA|nr:hypothetical protein GOP47_0011119 [Adiantum capillus-veneris]
MTQLFSPRTYTNHHESDDEDEGDDAVHGLVYLPEQSASISLESLEDLFESPLSPFTVDSSSPLVSPLSLSSDTYPHQQAFYRPSVHRRSAPQTSPFVRGIGSGLSERTPLELPVIALLLAAFKRTSLTCKAGLSSDLVKMDIGWPTNVRHINHVTFDRFNGFLGLPVEFELEVPRRAPSASASVFGVSAESMQCSYDQKGNSVPTILLLLQERLYNQGGLQAEGIFRINAENGQEENLRDQLNKGVVPYDIDVHCLAGLIKAWFRELPKGVLDNLTAEQVMQSNTEEQCVTLVELLPPTQAALLSWAINLMADVVQQEEFNKMNARNIAMVFAPNMTQMADPLTALMHAVQVMNLLKTMILKTVKDREEAALNLKPESFCKETKNENGNDKTDLQGQRTTLGIEKEDKCVSEGDGSFLNTFKESEPYEEFESALGSEDMFSRYCSTREITDEDETSFDSQGPQSNASSIVDVTDDDSFGLRIFTRSKSVRSAAPPSRQSAKKEGDVMDFTSYFNKAHFVPFKSNSKQKSKTHKASADTRGFVQCGVLESLSFKGKSKTARAASKEEQMNERVETW